MPLTLDHLKEETRRLVAEQRDLIQEALESDILTETEDQILSQARAAALARQLAGEAEKLETFEVTTAIIGTMKAGKSTTINAIVGQELMPARVAPMTALPTRIRHRPGQKTPTLTLSNVGILRELVEDLKAHLPREPHSAAYESVYKYGSNEIRELAHALDNGRYDDLAEHATGAGEIAERLRHVNDLVRLCDILEVPFPDNAFRESADLPLVEVEFVCLAEREGSGQFTLIDTPGPNEAQLSTRLLASLRDQIERASSVILVTNCGQKGSEAEAKLEDALGDYLKHTLDASRVFVFVNQFDLLLEEKEQSESERQKLKESQARHINSLAGRGEFTLSPTQVHLVSAREAFVAETVLRAGCRIDLTASWANAARQLCGIVDEEDLEDTKRIERAATKKLERSNFRDVRTAVIQHGFEHAAIISMQAAAKRMQEVADGMYKAAEIGAGNQSVDQIRETLSQLERLLADSDRLVEAARRSAEAAVAEARSEIDKITRRLRTDCLADAEGVKANFFGGSSSTTYRDYHVAKAAFTDGLSKPIKRAFNARMEKETKNINSSLSKASEKCKISVGETVQLFLKQAADMLESASYDLAIVEAPPFNTLALPRSPLDIQMLITTNPQQIVDEEGFWGSAKRFFGRLFGKDWGKVRGDSSFTIKESQVFSAINKNIDANIEEIRVSINSFFETSIRSSVSAYVQSVVAQVSSVSRSLDEAKLARQRSAVEFERRHALFVEFKRQTMNQRDELRNLKRSLDCLTPGSL